MLVSKSMEDKPMSTYKHNDYQCYIAAMMAKNHTSKFELGVLGPGQGKTYIMLLLGNYLL